MNEQFSLKNYPRAFIHIDGDCFFASCEVAKNPSLRGKCVVTGLERGIASSMTYETKACGVTRGMSLRDIKKLCPQVIFLPSDYETYSLYSLRMYAIVRRYTEAIEEYSIDECFAELTGLRRTLRMSYEKIAEKIKHDLDTELGMTFSIGLAPTKVLAKVGSKWKKPSGLTCIPLRLAHEFLGDLSTEKIWGIGPQTSALLRLHGVNTALEFVSRSKEWVAARTSKPYLEIWHELRGDVINELSTEVKHNYQSISKTKTFTPASVERAYVFSQLSKNIENACVKCRRHNLSSDRIYFFLKTQEFRYAGYEIKLSQAVSEPEEIIKAVATYFDVVFKANTPYRATGIVLSNLAESRPIQQDLFSQSKNTAKYREIYGFLDKLAQKFGKHTVFLGSSFKAITEPNHLNDRAIKSERNQNLLTGETKRKRLGIPTLGIAT